MTSGCTDDKILLRGHDLPRDVINQAVWFHHQGRQIARIAEEYRVQADRPEPGALHIEDAWWVEAPFGQTGPDSAVTVITCRS